MKTASGSIPELGFKELGSPKRTTRNELHSKLGTLLLVPPSLKPSKAPATSQSGLRLSLGLRYRIYRGLGLGFRV